MSLTRFALGAASCVAVVACGCLVAVAQYQQLIINEIEYDQPGVDNREWVELRNVMDYEFFTEGTYLVFYHGDPSGTCQEYCRIDLRPLGLVPEGSYTIIGVNPCAYPLPQLCAATDAIQNGPSDAIVLEQHGLVLDSVEYASDLVHSVCNFTRTNARDSDMVEGSIQRCGNAWVFAPASPCAPNHCAVSTVPDPRGGTWGAVRSLYKG